MNAKSSSAPPLDPVEEAIFNAASELADPPARGAFLDRACAQDAALRSRLEALLRAEQQAARFFAADPLQLARRPESKADDASAASVELPALLAQPQSEGPGGQVGRYKLLQKIGEGGMGVVYMAEQQEPVRRRVALKIIKLGMDTRSVVARFEAERQALALMDHPNIARILDGGATETGRPYFVMELVQGVAITEYCDRNRLPLPARIQLFVKVCEAVQSAHQKGIIHRDLKPSNVMVTLHDGVPVPKVIDFGVAKATNQELTAKTLFTHHATLIGTPAYMSPEQAEMSGLDVDTRSDLYSLGVLLYELLTGSTPFPEERLRSVGYGEMQRIIAQEEPLRPSTKLGQTLRLGVPPSGGPGPAKAGTPNRDAARIHQIKSLIATLRGDLDWIVMKCLEKDRTRRYETANGLAADLKRHLNDEPVVACPPSTVYRLQKAFRRHRLAWTAAGAVALALVLGIGVSVRQTFEAQKALQNSVKARQGEQQQRLVAESARAAAETQRQRAEQAQAGAEAAAAAARAMAIKSRRSQYAADMLACDTAIKAGNYGRARALLREYLPREGLEELRGFEWRHWWKLTAGEQLRSFPYSGEILSLAWSRDGRLIATGNADHTVKLLDPDTGEAVTTLRGHSGRVVSVAFAADGNGLATAADDGRIHFWDVRDGRLVFSLTNRSPRVACAPGRPLLAIGTGGDDWGQRGEGIQLVDTGSGQTLKVLPLAGDRAAFSPDGTMLATANGTGRRAVILWDVDSGRELRALENVPQALGLAFSPDGSLLAIGTREGEIKLWNLRDFSHTTLRQPTRDFARSVAFSPDGARLAVALQTHEVEIWDVRERQRVESLHGHAAQVWSVAFSPDGTRLASGSEDGTVKLWDPLRHPPGPLLPEVTLNHYFWLGHPRFSPDSRSVAVGTPDRNVQIRDAKADTWPVQRVLTNAGHPVAFSAAGTRLLTMNGPSFQEWDLASGVRRATRPAGTNAAWEYSAITADGSQVALAAGDLVQILDTRNGRLVDRFASPVSARSLEYSPDGKLLAICGAHGPTALWDIAARQVARTLAGHRTTVSSLRFSPDQKLIATASWDGTARLWDAATGQELAVLTGHKAALLGCAFSPDGRTLVTGSDDHAVRFWNVATFREVAALHFHVAMFYLAFSPDGETLVVSSAHADWHLLRAPSLAEIDAAEAAAAP